MKKSLLILLFGTTLLITIPLDAAEPATNEAAPPRPTFTNVSYGPDQRNVLDFWQAKGEGPRPLLVHIHGGGWTGGDKALKPGYAEPYLQNGISVASINYRLTPGNPLPAPVHDAARAIQFLRTKAEEWNFRKDRIALTGGSAGACSSMWILLHNDLADPDSSDPVLRESTRVTAAAVSSGQTSIDPTIIGDWMGPNVLKHRMIYKAVGLDSLDPVMQNFDKYRDLYIEFSPINHVSADDPPLLMAYAGDMSLPSKDAGHGIHHGMYGVKLKEKSDSVGHECHLLIPRHSTSDKYASVQEFLLDKLLTP